jgi:hypothetical protein
MTIERIFHSGAWKITGAFETQDDTIFFTRVYYGYTKREAIRLFREHIKEESAK